MGFSGDVTDTHKHSRQKESRRPTHTQRKVLCLSCCLAYSLSVVTHGNDLPLCLHLFAFCPSVSPFAGLSVCSSTPQSVSLIKELSLRLCFSQLGWTRFLLTSLFNPLSSPLPPSSHLSFFCPHFFWSPPFLAASPRLCRPPTACSHSHGEYVSRKYYHTKWKEGIFFFILFSFHSPCRYLPSLSAC